MRRRQSIVVGALLFTVLLVAGSYVQERAERFANWHTLLDRQASSRAELLRTWLDQEREGLQFIADTARVGVGAAAGELERGARTHRYLGLYLVDRGGSVQQRSPGAPEPGSAALALAAAALAGHPFRAEIGTLEKRGVVLLGLPAGPDGATALLAIVDGTELLPHLEHGMAFESEQTFLLQAVGGPAGTVGIAAAEDGDLRYAQLASRAPIALRGLAGGAWSGECEDFEGAPSLAVASRVPGADWAVVARVACRDIQAGVLLEVAGHAVPLLLGVLALSALLRASGFREKLAAEQTLRRVEIERNAILDNIPDIAWLKDAESRLLVVNRALARSVGREPAELIGQTDFDLYPRELAERYRADDADVMRTGISKRVVEPYTVPGAASIWIETVKTPIYDDSGAPIATAGIARDVSERLQLESALRHTNETLAALIKASPLGIVACDAGENITLWNPAAEALFGWSEAEVLGKPTPILLAEDANRIDTVRAQTASGQVARYDTVRVHKDGRRLDVHIDVGLLRGADGGPAGFVGLIQDVTEQRRAEALIEQARKLDSLGVLAGGVAHDFNNLLTAILGHATVAIGKLPPDSRALPNLRRVVESSERAAEISLKMLAFSGQGHFRQQVVDLGRAVRDALPGLRALCPPAVLLKLTEGPDPAPVTIDPEQLQQLLRHLVVNAAEACGDGPGQISIRARDCAVAAGDWELWRHTGVPLAPGDYVALEVADDGEGIASANLARVFDPFFSTRFTGRGLGLAVVLGIVRGHRGGVAIASEPGHGTRVQIVLPRAPSPT